MADDAFKDAYAEGKADAVALIRERAANALPEVARFTLDEIEAIVALAAPPSGAEAGEARQEHPQFCSTPDCGLRATTVKQLDAVRWGPVCDDCAAVPPTGTDTDLFADLVDLARAHHGIAVPPSGAEAAPPADFWREVPCGHPTDPVAWAGPDGYVCHCGCLLDGKQGQHVPEAPGPVVLCSKCGCHVACPPSGAEAGEGCRAPHCWSEYGTPCGTCPAGAEAGGDA